MSIRLIGGDCREVLATLPANSVHMVCTSPPYFGLRDYGTARWVGGDAACDHRGAPQRTRATLNANWGEGYADVKNADAFQPFRDTCGKCGATRVDRQIGLEATPDAYLAEMVAVFREVRRVLRPDGTCWVNMGDSYASAPVGSFNGGGFKDKSAQTGGRDMSGVATSGVMDKVKASGLKPKDLLMMPARLALALQADGWWLRSDIIWHKPNPMPESVTDRPTSAHEHVFLLAKSARYYYDADAVRETTGNEMTPDEYAAAVNGYPGRSNDMQDFGGGRGRKGFLSATPPSGRNCRNVWTIATAPYSEAHFATFPPALAERCIRAGTSERGCCAACGAPWVRVTKRSVAFTSGSGRSGNVPNGKHAGAMQALSGEYDIRMGPSVATTTTGWAPSCACDAATVPCTALDPFAGAGTTLLVADRLQRDAIGIELSPDYTRMAMDRCRDDAPLFAEPSPPPAEPPEEPRIRDLFAEPVK